MNISIFYPQKKGFPSEIFVYGLYKGILDRITVLLIYFTVQN